MIKPTEFITFPRSGHHLLMCILSRYFGDKLHYCEMYERPELKLEVCPTTNCQKNHDFDLKTVFDESRCYIIQIRDPLESIQSLLEAKLMAGESIADRHQFLVDQLTYWKSFVDKWVIRKVPNRLIVHYRDLIDKPYSTAWNAIEHISGSPAENASKLHLVIESCAVQSYLGTRKVTGI